MNSIIVLETKSGFFNYPRILDLILFHNKSEDNDIDFAGTCTREARTDVRSIHAL